MSRDSLRAALVFLVPLVAACASEHTRRAEAPERTDPIPPPAGVMGTQTWSGMGMLVGDASAEPIVAPETVRAGESFEVIVNTAGSSTCAWADSTAVRVRGDTADVVPYDGGRDGICSDDLSPIEHRASLRFARPGTGVIRVTGNARPAGSPPLVVEHRVRVIP